MGSEMCIRDRCIPIPGLHNLSNITAAIAATRMIGVSFKKIKENIKSLKLINMRNNRGHARCIAAGLKHISEKENFDYIVFADGVFSKTKSLILESSLSFLEYPDIYVLLF